MESGLLIVGTDTDVGKTLVTAAALRAALARGRRAVAIKPVQTGCRRLPNGEWVAPDVEFYQLASHGLAGARSHAVYAYEPACSPHLAARLAGQTISLAAIETAVQQARQAGEWVVVEGAGGLLVPLNESETILDLATRLALPILLVVANRLGAINHALLTLRAIRQANLPCVGLFFNQTTRPGSDEALLRADNPVTIAAFGHTPILGAFAYRPTWQPQTPEFWTAIDAEFATAANVLWRK